MIEGNETVASVRGRLYEGAEWLVAWQHRGELDLPPDDPHLRQRWLLWSSSDENGAAYDKIALTHCEIRACPRPAMPSEAECSSDEFDGSVSVEEWLTQNRHRAAAKPPRCRTDWRRPWQGVALVVGVAAAATVLLRPEWLSMRPTADAAIYETGFGENRKFRMLDGSTVTLGAKTALEAHFTDNRRMVVLTGGEGFFDVAHDPKRPFVVLAGSGYIKASGTSFNVSREADRVVVTVVEGTVDVMPRESSMDAAQTSGAKAPESVGWLPARLSDGQEMTYAENGTASAVMSADSKLATAWRDGRLQYRQESLRRVIMDVNRYWRRRQILYDGADELMYTGDVPQNNIDAWVRGLHHIFPGVEVLDTDSRHVLVRVHHAPATHESQYETGSR